MFVGMLLTIAHEVEAIRRSTGRSLQNPSTQDGIKLELASNGKIRIILFYFILFSPCSYVKNIDHTRIHPTERKLLKVLITYNHSNQWTFIHILTCNTCITIE